MYLYCHFAVSKMIGWQLCSDLTYSLTPRGFSLLGPVLFSLRLQKLDKSLKQYLMETAYTFVPQVDAVLSIMMSRYVRSLDFIKIFCAFLEEFLDAPKSHFASLSWHATIHLPQRCFPGPEFYSKEDDSENNPSPKNPSHSRFIKNTNYKLNQKM